jgi:hypothetical protein
MDVPSEAISEYSLPSVGSGESFRILELRTELHEEMRDTGF